MTLGIIVGDGRWRDKSGLKSTTESADETGIVYLWSAFLMLALLPGACKRASESATHGRDSAGTNAATASSQSPAPQIAIVKPTPKPAQTAVPAGELAAMIEQNLGFKVPAEGMIAVQIDSGETVLFGKDQFGLSPVGSVLDGVVYEWDIQAPGKIDRNRFEVRSTNLAYRHAVGGSETDPDAVPYLIYTDVDGVPVVTLYANHAVASNGTFRISMNRVFNDQNALVYAFDEVAPNAWRVSGDFYNGYVCSGALVWRDDSGSYFSAANEFGRTTVATWTDAGQSLELTGTVAMDLPSRLADQLQPCPFNRESDLAKIFASLEYDPSYDDHPKPDAPTAPLRLGEIYRTGQLVSYDNALWTVLEANPDLKRYLLLNKYRNFPEDNGKSYTRIYVLEPGVGFEAPVVFKEFTKTPQYLVSAPLSPPSLFLPRMPPSVNALSLRSP